MREQGCHDFKVLDQVSPASNDAAIGDVADEVEATLLVLSTEVRKRVPLARSATKSSHTAPRSTMFQWYIGPVVSTLAFNLQSTSALACTWRFH